DGQQEDQLNKRKRDEHDDLKATDRLWLPCHAAQRAIADDSQSDTAADSCKSNSKHVLVLSSVSFLFKVANHLVGGRRLAVRSFALLRVVVVMRLRDKGQIYAGQKRKDHRLDDAGEQLDRQEEHAARNQVFLREVVHRLHRHVAAMNVSEKPKAK